MQLIMPVDASKSIEQLTGDVWSGLGLTTNLMEKVHRYRKIPLAELTVEQLRLLIGQSEELSCLVPLAFSELAKNPLAEGDFYEGDLLNSVLSVNSGFWKKNQVLKAEVLALISSSRKVIEESDANQKRQLLEKMDAFSQL